MLQIYDIDLVLFQVPAYVFYICILQNIIDTLKYIYVYTVKKGLRICVFKIVKEKRENLYSYELIHRMASHISII